MVSSSSTLTNESREGKGDSRKYKVKIGIKQDDVTKEYHKVRARGRGLRGWSASAV